jgi:hypothetical protein
LGLEVHPDSARALLSPTAWVSHLLLPWRALPPLLADADHLGWLLWRLAAALVAFLPFIFPRAIRWRAPIIQGGLIGLAAASRWWPALAADQRLAILLVGGLALVLVLSAWCLPVSASCAWICAAAAAALFLCVPLFDGSMAWYTVGIKFGTRHWQTLYWCKAANLGAILQETYHWKWTSKTDVSWFLPFVSGPWKVEVRSVMIALYAIGLLLCSIAAARHYRRHDRRFLYAIVAPWAIMYAFMPQMVDRYAMWGAALAAAIAVMDIFGLMFYVMFNVMAVVAMAHFMIGMPPGEKSTVAKEYGRGIVGTFPALGWGAIALTSAMLALALIPGRLRWRERLWKAAVAGHAESNAPTPGRTGAAELAAGPSAVKVIDSAAAPPPLPRLPAHPATLRPL